MQPWQVVAGVTAIAMMLLNFHRSNFTMLVPGIAAEMALTSSQVKVFPSMIDCSEPSEMPSKRRVHYLSLPGIHRLPFRLNSSVCGKS
jgi:hypothetical protein